MKRFKFGLETLARVYLADKEQKQRALARAQRFLGEAEDLLVRHGLDYERCQSEESLRRDKGETVVEMRLFVLYAFEIKHRIEEQKKVVVERIKEVTRARHALLESSRRVKALERLKERRLNEWKKDRSRWEREFTDEVNQQRFVRAAVS